MPKPSRLCYYTTTIEKHARKPESTSRTITNSLKVDRKSHKNNKSVCKTSNKQSESHPCTQLYELHSDSLTLQLSAKDWSKKWNDSKRALFEMVCGRTTM